MAQSKQFDFSFVNISLNDKEKAQLKSQPFTLDDLDNAALRLSQEGYKISLSYDSKHNCYSAFLFPTATCQSNKGLMLSGKGSTPVKALKQLFYGHYVQLREEWSDGASNTIEIDD